MQTQQFSTTFQPFRSTKYNFTNLTGRRFDRLLVFGIYGKSVNKMSLWLCRCDCGNWRVIAANNLNGGHSRSCGCLSIETVRKRSRTHGESYSGITAEYRSYSHAKTRCNNPNAQRYEDWGGRGIEFRFKSFEDFLATVGRRPSAQHSLDRIDPNGHYEAGNVRWATPKEQSRNTRRNHYVTINSERKCIAEWCVIYKIKSTTVHQRIKAGLSDEAAITTPLRS